MSSWFVYKYIFISSQELKKTGNNSIIITVMEGYISLTLKQFLIFII